MRRARETAEAIAAPHGRAPVVEPGFNEIDFGAWQGLGFDRLAGDRDWAEWNARRGLAPTPGGETMLAVQARAVAALQHLPARYPDGELVVVSHGDVINAVLLHLLGMPLDLLHRLRIDPAGRSTLMLYGGDAEVICVNVAA